MYHNLEEIYGLIPQTKQSVISIASNIAKGAGRRGSKEFIRFLKYQMSIA